MVAITNFVPVVLFAKHGGFCFFFFKNIFRFIHVHHQNDGKTIYFFWIHTNNIGVFPRSPTLCNRFTEANGFLNDCQRIGRKEFVRNNETENK